MATTDKLMNSKISQTKANVSDYINSLKAVLSLKSFIVTDGNGVFYFGGSLTYREDGENPQTPDIVVEINDNYLVGEVKKSLTNPKGFNNEEDYINYIEKDIICQLKKYDGKFKEIERENHDLFLLVPYRDIDAVGTLKIKYLEARRNKGEKIFKNPFGLLTFSIEA